METRQFIIYLAVKHGGNWDEIYKNIVDFKEEDRLAIDYPLNLDCKALTIIDEEYPRWLKEIYKPPFVLFYYGDLSLIQNPYKCLAVVGPRVPNPKAVEHTERIIGELSKDIVIVSGLASGIDSIAHQSAINHGLKTVAVLGTGIDMCYPSENYDLYKIMSESHLVISERPPKAFVEPFRFALRNRIISGLSKTVFIPDGLNKSGTAITAMFALQQNRDLCCLPGEINADSLCNSLIKRGAYLVEKGEDIMDIMGFGKLLFPLK